LKPVAAVEEMRKALNTKFRVALEKAYDQVITDEGGAKEMSAFCTVAKSIRELNGLDAPTKIDVKADMTVQTFEEKQAALLGVADKLEEADAANATEV
jgi:hypothetical protein